MALVDLNWNPTDRQLRQFGGVSLFALPLLGWLWGGSPTLIGTTAVIGAVLAVLAWFVPAVIKPLFIGLSIAALPIGIVVGEVILFTVFALVFLPMGIVFRLTGRDSLKLRSRTAVTYWSEKSQPRNAASYYRQS